MSTKLVVLIAILAVIDLFLILPTDTLIGDVELFKKAGKCLTRLICSAMIIVLMPITMILLATVSFLSKLNSWLIGKLQSNESSHD